MIVLEKMNPEVKEKWLAALRSGEYLQGIGSLRRYNSVTGESRYCCFGVLCELALEQGVISSRDESGGITAYDGIFALPSEAIARWAGLDQEDFRYLPDDMEGFIYYSPRVTRQTTNAICRNSTGVLANQLFEGTGTVALSALNDSAYPFSVIADVIELDL